MSIALSGVELNYGNHQVLRGLNGELRPGVVGLLGVNGAGKTTLLQILATVLRASAGRIDIGGASPATHSGRREVRARLGYLPQTAGWNSGFTVEELCHYFAWLRRVPRSSREAHVTEALAAVNLAEHRGQKLGKLSGGQHRRAMLAQALVHHPTVMLLDEPTSGLDPQQRVAFRATVQKLAKEEERTVVLSTHLVEDVVHSADQVVVLHDGHFAFSGGIEEMRALAYSDEAGTSPWEQAFHRIVSGGATSR